MTEPAVSIDIKVIMRQLVVINDIERAIRHARELDSDILLRQHKHLKARLLKQLNELLEEQGFNIKAVEEE